MPAAAEQRRLVNFVKTSDVCWHNAGARSSFRFNLIVNDTLKLHFNRRVSAFRSELCAPSDNQTKADIALTAQRICGTKTRRLGTRADRRATGANILQPVRHIWQTRAHTR